MHKILIVDDSSVIRQAIRHSLEYEGFTVFEAGNGADALTLLQVQVDIGLVITDISMPKMDGLSMAMKVKADPKLSHVKVCMLTSESSKSSKEQARKAGISAWFTKPFKVDTMIPAVKKILGIAPMA